MQYWFDSVHITITMINLNEINDSLPLADDRSALLITRQLTIKSRLLNFNPGLNTKLTQSRQLSLRGTQSRNESRSGIHGPASLEFKRHSAWAAFTSQRTEFGIPLSIERTTTGEKFTITSLFRNQTRFKSIYIERMPRTSAACDIASRTASSLLYTQRLFLIKQKAMETN